jgi:two-component system CheB/CheR fusion protein
VTNEELRLRTREVGDVNTFMEAVLAGLRAAVLVVDREQRLLVWNRQAEELWGVRREEALGQHLLTLDIGLPLERLTAVLRDVLAGRTAVPQDPSGTRPVTELNLPALNRRGRAVDVRVTVTPLLGEGAVVTGAIIVVDQEGLTPA